MSDFAITQQGRFVSTGTDKTLQVRSGVNWIKVYNQTAQADATRDRAIEFYFQDGMAQGTGLNWTLLGTQPNDPVTAGVLVAPAGFTLIDSSDDNRFGPELAITSSTNTTTPVFTVPATTGLVNGSVIRLYNTVGQRDLSGTDWAVTAVDATHFTIASVLANVPGNTATNAGKFQLVRYNPLFYPRNRFIVKILANVANPARTDITLSVQSGYKIGQEVRILIGDVPFYGMPEIDNLVGIITAVNDTLAAVGGLPALTITVDIDSSSFTAFKFPTNADAISRAYTRAMVVPIGIDITTAVDAGVDQLSDATINQGYIGVVLSGGAAALATAGPAGAVGDVMFWVAGTSVVLQN